MPPLNRALMYRFDPPNNVCSSEKVKEEAISMDHISTLPHALLVEILSRLTLKEAARTSILSGTWVDLWKFVPNLDFDVPKVRQCIWENYWNSGDMEPVLFGRRRYIEWVNRVLTHYQGRKVNNFHVCFNIHNESNANGDIDRWLDFAISKRVQKLKLDFERYGDASWDASGCYIFSERCFKHMKTSEGLSDIRFLQSLCLAFVDVSDEILEHFLCNCPLLEKLAVQHSHGLVRFKVAAGLSSPLPLKHLEVAHCKNLKEIEIDAPNLTYFKLDGRFPDGINLRMENISSLTGLDLYNMIDPGPVFLPRAKFARLETLTFMFDARKAKFPRSIEELTSLKQLTVYVLGSDRNEIRGLLPVINACPSLYQLSVRMDTDEEKDSSYRIWGGSEMEEMHRESIKVVEVSGFAGNAATHTGRWFLDYALRNFVTLEKLILDSRTCTSTGRIFKAPRVQAEVAVECIQMLKSRLPSTVELVIPVS
ncbi:unnamed protein product [Linum tenue]|uniref:F-box domain-containing protein n=1 Tax=Linum tenue TaxID=586396 RepID=A0AAV0KCA5_9ROSI|nr:unnamed protein product [Linum tenue]